MLWKSFASSANKRILHGRMTLDTASIKILNNKGDRWPPCGITDVTTMLPFI